MKSILYLLAAFLGYESSMFAQADGFPIRVEFPSKDGLVITANTYFIESEKPIILLCHQAGYNKTEYAEIAPKLNELGFSVMAIDQRSGGKLKGTRNETHDRAKEQGKARKYIDAEQDILAAIDYAYEKGGKPIILWGSSYSAGLAMHIAPINEKVVAVLAFSPGDYFGKDKAPIADGLENFQKPMFVTSSKLEAGRTKKLLEGLELNDNQDLFIPKGIGKHGSSALWESSNDHLEYWKAVKMFLRQF